MKKLSIGEIRRIQPMLVDDETKRNLATYWHANDVMASHCVVPFSIWPLPNADMVDVIAKKVDYNNLPFEDQKEVEKGILFEDQREFISEYFGSGSMLCEAMEYRLCLKAHCPLFYEEGTPSGGQYGVCSEFKIAFKK